MRSSRGMGCIAKDKIPGKKTIKRKDSLQGASEYKKGGWIKDNKKRRKL